MGAFAARIYDKLKTHQLQCFSSLYSTQPNPTPSLGLCLHCVLLYGRRKALSYGSKPTCLFGRCCDIQVVLNSKHLRGLRSKLPRRSNKSCSGLPKRASPRAGVPRERTHLGRVEYLPVEWHTRFKGRLYREAGGRGGGGGGQGSGRTDTQEGYPEGEHFSGDRRRTASSGAPTRRRFERKEVGEGESPPRVGVAGGNGGVSAGELSIWDITLPRAPTLRAFTNDTLLDILYFMSPEYHQARVGLSRRRGFECERAHVGR